MRIDLARQVVMDGENERTPEKFGEENDIRRSVLQVHQIRPANRLDQIPIRPIANEHILALQHRFEIGLKLRAFGALETKPHLDLRIAPDRAGDREHERLDPAVAALAGRNDQHL